MKAWRIPLLLFAAPALLFSWAPASHAALVLDRTAVSAGQFWRLWSGHWVHYSGSHLGWNLAVLLVAGSWLEHLHPGRLLAHSLLAPPLIGLAVLLAEPSLQSYAGLSGLATGVVMLLVLDRLAAPGRSRRLWAGVLALVLAKVTADLLHDGSAFFAHYGSPHIRTATSAHAAGAVVAWGHHLAGTWIARPARKDYLTGNPGTL